MNIDEKCDRLGLGEFLMLAVVAGLVFSGIATCFDVLHNARSCAPIDLLIAIGLMAATAIPIYVVLSAVYVIVLGFYGPARDRTVWIPLLTALTVIALLVAVFAMLESWERAQYGWLILPAVVPAGIIAFGTTLRGERIIQGGQIMISALVATLLCVLMTALFLKFEIDVPSALLYGGIPVCLLLFLVVARILVIKRWAGIGVGLAGAAAGLALALSAWRGPALAPASMVSEMPEVDDAHGATPNVILIVLDTTRRDHLGAYGKSPSLTPALDTFSRESVIYEGAFSTAPWTVPSHASMFTGLYPVTHGCTHEHHLWLDDHFLTLSDRLKELGYQTVAFNSNPYVQETNLLQGFEQVSYLVGAYEDLVMHSFAATLGVPEHWVDKGSAEAVDALKTWLADGRDPTRPYFMFVNLYEAHRDYVPPLSAREGLTSDDVTMSELIQFWADFNPNLLQLTRKKDERAQKIVQRLYEAEIRYQDRRLGEFLDLLRVHGSMDESLVIVTADHGENLGEEGRWEHLHEINDALIHVPLFVRYPQREHSRTRIGGFCQVIDFLPTIYDVLGRPEKAENLPGRSLRPDSFEPYEAVFAQVAPYYLHFPFIEANLGFRAHLGTFSRHRRAIRTPTMKYVWASDGAHELYDMTRDPTESTNLVEDDPENAQRLHDQLMSWYESLPKYVPPPSSAPGDHVSESIDFKRLKSLGYIGG